MAMTTIDEEIDQMVKECPILLDEDFQRQHPAIIEVARFLDAVAETAREETGKYGLFNTLKVNNISEYIQLIQNENPDAIRVYEKTRDILRLG